MVPRLTIVLPFYDNQGMMALQLAMWAAWPEALRSRLSVIIVDDGSPAPAKDVSRPDGLDIAIFRILGPDLPWWQHGARNIGAHEAADGWLLLTDMDHVLTAGSAAKLFHMKLDPATAYMLDRVEADTGLPTLGRGGQPKPHPNSFVMTRAMFWRAGGYDERACGIYGTDRLFRDRLYSAAKRGHLNVPLVRYWRDIVPDASTRTLPRKEGRDPEQRRRIFDEIKAAPEAIRLLSREWVRAC